MRDTFARVPPVALSDLAMDPLDPVPFHLTHQLLNVLSPEAIDELPALAGPDSGVTILQLRHMGGALAREKPGAGVRATLPGEICMIALGVVVDPQSDALVRLALAEIDAAVLPNRAGHYPNFVEVPADARRFFAPADWKRLRAVKRHYDVTDLFAGAHHIPAA